MAFGLLNFFLSVFRESCMWKQVAHGTRFCKQRKQGLTAKLPDGTCLHLLWNGEMLNGLVRYFLFLNLIGFGVLKSWILPAPHGRFHVEGWNMSLVNGDFEFGMGKDKLQHGNSTSLRFRPIVPKRLVHVSWQTDCFQNIQLLESAGPILERQGIAPNVLKRHFFMWKVHLKGKK